MVFQFSQIYRCFQIEIDYLGRCEYELDLNYNCWYENICKSVPNAPWFVNLQGSNTTGNMYKIATFSPEPLLVFWVWVTMCASICERKAILLCLYMYCLLYEDLWLFTVVAYYYFIDVVSDHTDTDPKFHKRKPVQKKTLFVFYYYLYRLYILLFWTHNNEMKAISQRFRYSKTKNKNNNSS